MLLPEFMVVLVVALIPILGGFTDWGYLWAMIVSGLVICVPAMAFVTAFSLACPMVMPVRVYQVLFTGYWFWGNFLSASVFPTISETILNASGTYALQGFFGSGFTHSGEFYQPGQAVLNILVIFIMAAAALTGVTGLLSRRAARV
jgi:hypothetical protein